MYELLGTAAVVSCDGHGGGNGSGRGLSNGNGEGKGKGKGVSLYGKSLHGKGRGDSNGTGDGDGHSASGISRFFSVTGYNYGYPDALLQNLNIRHRVRNGGRTECGLYVYGPSPEGDITCMNCLVM